MRERERWDPRSTLTSLDKLQWDSVPSAARTNPRPFGASRVAGRETLASRAATAHQREGRSPWAIRSHSKRPTLERHAEGLVSPS